MNLSTPHPEGQDLFSTGTLRLNSGPRACRKAQAEGLKVHSEPHSFIPSLKTGPRAAERVKEKGFSLIELIIVLILFGLSASLVTPSLSRLSKTMELKGAVKKVTAILHYFRSEAVNKGKVYQVLFDTNSKEVRVQSPEVAEGKEEDEKKKSRPKTYLVPEGVMMKEIQMVDPQYPVDVPAIEFYPNGGSNGGSLVLDTEGRKGYKIKVNFLTGIVEVERVT
jgi:type II secretion system protein H